MCKKYEVGGGKAAAQLRLLTQPAKSELLPTLLLLPLPLPLLLKPLLLPTLLLLKPLRDLNPKRPPGVNKNHPIHAPTSLGGPGGPRGAPGGPQGAPGGPLGAPWGPWGP